MTDLLCGHSYGEPPRWASLERRLLDDMAAALDPFLARYTEPDGSLTWCDRPTNSGDDFYEPFYNWPLLYILGGDPRVLELAKRQWHAITAQLDRLGSIKGGFIDHGDWWHLGETYIFFYYLCLAAPDDPEIIASARRFADLYAAPDAPNFDAAHAIIRSPLNGGAGPKYEVHSPDFVWYDFLAPFGLPYHDVPGITTYDHLKDRSNAVRMHAVMQQRMPRGDVAMNMAAAGLVANAFLLTGDERYRSWVVDYVSGWESRARANGGLVPDNVGPSGEVGETMSGKWYGSLYGWTWPHGFYNIQLATVVAATSATLVDGDPGHLDLVRQQLDRITDLAVVRPVRGLVMSLAHNWYPQTSVIGEDNPTLVAPYRYGDPGWFDYAPLWPMYPVALWNASERSDDWQRVLDLQARSGYDWSVFIRSRNKEDAGHEAPWISFLQGSNLTYPEVMLGDAVEHVAEQVRRIAADTHDFTSVADEDMDIIVHEWQYRNPVSCEGLVQLTLGAPQVTYNGGLLVAPARYFDPDRQRAGLPLDVAALVTARAPGFLCLTLVNLGEHVRTTVITAGALGEHRFTGVTCGAHEAAADGLGVVDGACDLELTTADGGGWVVVPLAPRSWVRLKLTYLRHVTPATARAPWERPATALATP